MCFNYSIFFTGLALVLFAFAIVNVGCFTKFCNWIFFSKKAPFVTFGAGSVWFLTKVWVLSEADFGDYRGILFAFFAILIVLAFCKMREFLSVRGLAILMLLSADLLLKDVKCVAILGKNFFVTFVYLMILSAALIGSLPYTLKKCSDFLLQKNVYRRAAACLLATYGLLLLKISLQ